MQAVQGFEFTLRWLYLVANVDPEKVSNASLNRQWYNTFVKVSRAFQMGSAGMRLKDRDKGLKKYISESLYDEIDAFIRNRRNPLAHNFLVGRLSDDGSRYMRGTILERCWAGHDAIPPRSVAWDFDEELGNLDPADVQVVQPSRQRRLSVQFTLEGDDAVALQRIADDQGERPGEVVRSLIRAASAKAA
jgi:hypothetical protein